MTLLLFAGKTNTNSRYLEQSQSLCSLSQSLLHYYILFFEDNPLAHITQSKLASQDFYTRVATSIH